MEADLAALNGKVHFADDEKFSLPSVRHINESAKSIAMNASSGHAVSPYMSYKKTTTASSRVVKGSGGGSVYERRMEN